MNKHKRGFTSRRHPEPALLPLRAALKGCYSGSNKTISGSSRIFNKGFTLLEVLVVVLIIGVLTAIAVPQYQRAVLKSRFAALMPIAKSMADSNEDYYLEHGEYADNAEDLPVQGRRNYSDGTELEFGTLTGYSYVLATRDNDFPNKYIVYQKHSEQFPGEIHCEADSNNTQAQEVCKSFGATEDIGETLTPGYLTYVLFGTGNGVAPSGDEPAEPETPTCEGVSCDDDGNITECASGLTLKNGECVACDIANAATCSTTSYAAASCNEGYMVSYAGACVDYEQLRAVANNKCPAGQSNYSCTIKNGAVYLCRIYSNGGGTIDAKTDECVSNGRNAVPYEAIYDADANEIGGYQCLGISSNHCYRVSNMIPTGDGYKLVSRTCKSEKAITKEGACSNGYDSTFLSYDATYDSHDNKTSQFICKKSDISTETGECEAYSSMTRYDRTYDTNGNLSNTVTHTCTSISEKDPTQCLVWNPPL